MNHDKYISELLSEYDCVIIPGFGGFIGNYSPARINPTFHTFYPPFKSLLFNPHLKQNDGLLAVHVSAGENISYADALESLEILARRWQRQLNSGTTVEIDEVGKLSKDSEGTIRFVQNEKINFLPGSYGLSTVISPAIKRDVAGVRAEKKTKQHESIVAMPRQPLPGLLKWAALLALPVGTAALIGLTNLEKIKSLSVAYSGMLFSGASYEPVKHPLAAKPIVVPKPTEIKVTPPPVKEVRHVPVVAKKSQDKPFAIIIGAFRFLENANSLVADLKSKGYDAAITGQTKTGLYRVQLNAFSDRKEAYDQLTLVRSKEFPAAWLLVK